MKQDIKFLTRIVSLVSAGKLKKLSVEIKRASKRKVNVRRIEEAILQCYLFAGFPAVIESFKVLRDVVGQSNAKAREYEVGKFYVNGVETCRKVYKEDYEKLIQNMKALHPEIAQWMIIEGYGKVLSRDVLSLKEREILNVAILTMLGWERQLRSHLKGALNVGVERRQIFKVFKNIADICGRRKIKKAKEIFLTLQKRN
ncbi:4-carboxymuconolactone decarboxylase [Candidatus Thermokryptus mobilis]|uniref:4-carboxymuconolactone decarboxylase n=1 Tax=Candidatus Thermokryptus mobilis TaxID=1643428 RepID=A0A0S4MPE1_9BACT|nr:carboxymuconolactone decarboxylase family protein [Candidatus Thermokryptus mobilis]CUU00912.1 4-carboxymuconolactone decarboxylase [Candidatus Thermokryptus mobilis]